MIFPGTILGFHGCDRDVAEAILAGEEDVRVSDNPYDWLGSGAYFWENNPARALSWARFLVTHPGAGRGRVTTPAVVGAIIVPSSCLDLAEESSLAMIKSAYAEFVGFQSALGFPLPQNESGFKGDQDIVKRHLDCAVLNLLHESRKKLALPPFDTVRAPFLEGEPLFPGSKLSAKTHVQWCVRNPKESIIGYFRPRDVRASSV